MKRLVRVTQLESFRKYITGDEDRDLFVVTEQDVINSITGVFTGNECTRIGTAFHRIIEGNTDGVEKIAEVYGPESGIVMEVFTDCMGVQLYTGNFMEGQIGKKGHLHHRHEGFCLETQYYPNAINEPNFVRPITEAGEVYETVTIYGFDVR
jgi:galactose mutarotase-like enzyme